ncbi:uracil-DNA glycosylase [Undibacterium cyanobacteriorum]|uniref:Uracil-DNA glycosylase n=1 Tax=Undibacterium cyanobacteriorum TaxID=3073561 RepID=A0ABY9RCV8_9BURK|nr:uracil-DNA glycosylase [Undibacterium sp. 20NA77.5]WMW79086.1 uracil-DNA glycosylase [Undibacterium sp. 20NA77.5]
MAFFEAEIARADPSWRAALRAGLAAIERDSPAYLEQLVSSEFLPQSADIFAAFSLPIDKVKYVLVGEGPYPRLESANGYCFMDAAVTNLWSEQENGGLSKAVNRATSLRNFMKMLLVAEQHISLEELNPKSIADFASRAKGLNSPYIRTMTDLQTKFLDAGFLLLNASLVFRESVSPAVDARAWLSFMRVIVTVLAENAMQQGGSSKPYFVLWGKIADRCLSLPELANAKDFRIVRAEHPYNLSFIANPEMHSLFRPLTLLNSAQP